MQRRMAAAGTSHVSVAAGPLLVIQKMIGLSSGLTTDFSRATARSVPHRFSFRIAE